MSQKVSYLKRYLLISVMYVCCVMLSVVYSADSSAYAAEYSWEEEFLNRLHNTAKTCGKRVELSDLHIPEGQSTDVEELFDSSVADFFCSIYLTSTEGYISHGDLYYTNYYDDEDGNIDKEKYCRDYAKMYRVINNIMLAVDEDMSDVEKVLYAHDWLVEQTDYAYEEYLNNTITWDDYSYVGPFLRNKAVCSGYTQAMWSLMDLMDINVYEVISGEMNHAWNMVELDGVWYHLDATWDDPVYTTGSGNGDYWKEGEVRHTYFLKSDEEFLDLRHYDWVDYDTPEASVSGAFEGAIFDDVFSNFGYKDGKWYYAYGSNIIQSDYEGNDIVKYNHGNTIVNGILVDDIFLFADWDGVYSLPIEQMADGAATKRFDVNGYINEFAVKDGTVIIVSYDYDTEEYVTATNYISLSEILEIDSLEAYYPFEEVEVGDAVNVENVIVTAKTKNGYLVPVSTEDCSFSAVNTDTPGDKALQIDYKGVQVQMPLSVSYSLTGEYELDSTEYTYTGALIEPVPAIFYKGERLQQGQDFRLSYANNCNAGTATITVEGQGSYSGSFTISFEITKKIITEEDVEVSFPEMNGSEIDSEEILENLIVMVQGVILTKEEYSLGSYGYYNNGGKVLLQSVGLEFSNYKMNDTNWCYCDVYLLPEGWDDICDFVERLYSIVLGRTPDQSGMDMWAKSLATGEMTGVRVADGFIMSDELLNKDLSNEEFVKILYRAFFGREADADGLATWKGLLDAGCKKTYVFAGFANSAEFGNLCTEAGIVQGRAAEYLADRQTGLSEADYKVWCFVERMYTEVLKRTADEPGVKTWVGVLKDGSYTGAQVAEGFLMSDEFLAKNMTNEEYVRIMYRAFFNRDADAEGLATWTNALANGWTKQDIFAGFANSNEFGVLCEQAGIVQGTAEGK